MLLMCCVTLGQSLNLSEPQSVSGMGMMIVLVGFSEKVGPGEVPGTWLAFSKGRANTLFIGFRGQGWGTGDQDGPSAVLGLRHYPLSVKSWSLLCSGFGTEQASGRRIFSAACPRPAVSSPSFSFKVVPWQRQHQQLPFPGSAFGVTDPKPWFGGNGGSRSSSRADHAAAAAPGVEAGERTHLPAHPDPEQVPEVLQEGPAGLGGQRQGECPHQLIHPLLCRKLLQSSKHLLLGGRLVPQDLVHLRGRV